MEPLTPEQVLHFMNEVPRWHADPEVSMIACTYNFNSFKEGIAFVNRIADLAEAEDHHPNIFVHDYKNVTVTLTTHAIGGLSENDFIMAAKIDAIYR